VLDAVLGLFADGVATPTVTQVAERAGLSLRSVHRYFEDRDALLRAAIERSLELVRPLVTVDAPGIGPLEGRVERLVRSRVSLYEEFGPMMRAVVAHAPTNPTIAAQQDRNRAALGRQVEQMFAPELAGLDPVARAEVAALADVACSFETYEHLRVRRSLGSDQLTRTMVRGLLAVLDHAGAPAS
jgi:AcrR family transcriptional regulator